MKKLLVLVLVIVLAGCQKRMVPVAVEFTNIEDQNIEFGTDVCADIAQKTIVANIDIDSFGDTSKRASIVGKGMWAFYVGTNSESIGFMQSFSGSLAFWRSGNGSITTGLHCVAISYDNSSTANDPVLYVDGISVAVTEIVSPSGSLVADTLLPMQIGAVNGWSPSLYKSLDGKEQNIKIYNGILTADDIKNICNSRSISYLRNGLVFHAPMIGAAGLQVFDGTTLGADNKIRDWVSGAEGTPYGNPIGRGNTIQRIL